MPGARKVIILFFVYGIILFSAKKFLGIVPKKTENVEVVVKRVGRAGTTLNMSLIDGQNDHTTYFALVKIFHKCSVAYLRVKLVNLVVF